MDIQAYFDRIGYTGTRELTRDNLTLLIRQHLEAVPFENLDCYPGGCPLSNDPKKLFEKIVVNRRGGICFELAKRRSGLLPNHCLCRTSAAHAAGTVCAATDAGENAMKTASTAGAV